MVIITAGHAVGIITVIIKTRTGGRFPAASRSAGLAAEFETSRLDGR
jgi:hypothetical protein